MNLDSSSRERKGLIRRRFKSLEFLFLPFCDLANIDEIRFNICECDVMIWNPTATVDALFPPEVKLEPRTSTVTNQTRGSLTKLVS